METAMIFICGTVSKIIQEKTLSTNKIPVIYFCPNCVNFSFFYSGPPARVPMLAMLPPVYFYCKLIR